jgi:hypothetical protein
MDVDDRQHYDFGSLPSQWAEPKVEKSPSIEGYGLEGVPIESPPPSLAEMYSAPVSKVVPKIEPAPSQAPTDKLDKAYQVDLPVSTPPAPPAVPAPEEKKGPERVPQPPPLPPPRPLWRGVYTFPWRLENLKVWIALGLGLGSVGYLVAAFYLLVFGVKILDSEGFNPTAAFLVLIIPPMAIAAFLSGLYGSAQFIAIVEDTAAGNDRYQRPEVVTDWFGSLLHLAYIGFCTMLPSVAIAAGGASVFASPWGLLMGFVPAMILFPIFLLSSIAGLSSMAIIHGNVIMGFLRKPLLFPVFFLASSVMAAACLGLGYVVFLTFSFFMAFVMGFSWSACLIIYARLLGRVGWVLSQSGVKVKKRKKRRKKPTPNPDDWGASAEESNMEFSGGSPNRG